MIQLNLDGYQVGYTCKCGKSFDTMSKIKTHHSKAHKIKRETIQINFVLEQYGMTSIKKAEIDLMPNLTSLTMLSEPKNNTNRGNKNA